MQVLLDLLDEKVEMNGDAGEKLRCEDANTQHIANRRHIITQRAFFHRDYLTYASCSSSLCLSRFRVYVIKHCLV